MAAGQQDRVHLSVSERPFPTSQSVPLTNRDHRRECIREAIPDQPEHRRQAVTISSECIREAIPDQPEPPPVLEINHLRVYQRGHSRPARANGTMLPSDAVSVSERPFPTSQSVHADACCSEAECIREAIPDQPELTSRRRYRRLRVYQRGHSRPARATSSVVRCRGGVYQRGHSRPARAEPSRILRRTASVSERPFPTSQS